MISGRLAALRLVLGLALGVAAQPAAAQELAPGELMRRLAAVDRSSATFVETRHSALLKEPLVLRGTLTYRRPASLEKRVEQPYQERVAIDGDVLTIENRRGRKLKTSVSGSPGMAALVEGIRATRAGDLAALERHFQVSVARMPSTSAAMPGEPETVVFSLRPRRLSITSTSPSMATRSWYGCSTRFSSEAGRR